jgi:hypothetical protein
MRARGLSYAEIAQQLQVSRASIGSDVQYLREQAKETIKEYVTEHLPEQYEVCLTVLDAIIKRAFDILETSPDIDPMPILSFDSLFLCTKDYLDLCHTSIYKEFNTGDITAVI